MTANPPALGSTAVFARGHRRRAANGAAAKGVTAVTTAATIGPPVLPVLLGIPEPASQAMTATSVNRSGWKTPRPSAVMLPRAKSHWSKV